MSINFPYYPPGVTSPAGPPIPQPSDPLPPGNHRPPQNHASQLEEAARRGAEVALEQLRISRKQNRQDSGSGSKELGAIVTQARGQSSRVDFAKRAGLHPTTISKIESGDRGMSIKTFFQIHMAIEDPVQTDAFFRDCSNYYRRG